MNLSTAATNRPRCTIRRGPEHVSFPQAASKCSPSSPMAANRPGEVFFPTSRNRSRRHCLSHSGATRASPSPLSSPGASSPPSESIPLLDFDRDSPREKNHFARRPPSAAKLAAGSSVHPRDRIDHRSDRLDPLNPRMASVCQTVPPFASEHRQSSTSVRSAKATRAWTGQT